MLMKIIMISVNNSNNDIYGSDNNANTKKEDFFRFTSLQEKDRL